MKLNYRITYGRFLLGSDDVQCRIMVWIEGPDGKMIEEDGSVAKIHFVASEDYGKRLSGIMENIDVMIKEAVDHAKYLSLGASVMKNIALFTRVLNDNRPVLMQSLHEHRIKQIEDRIISIRGEINNLNREREYLYQEIEDLNKLLNEYKNSNQP